jgi:hypothetical protein
VLVGDRQPFRLVLGDLQGDRLGLACGDRRAGRASVVIGLSSLLIPSGAETDFLPR